MPGPCEKEMISISFILTAAAVNASEIAASQTSTWCSAASAGIMPPVFVVNCLMTLARILPFSAVFDKPQVALERLGPVEFCSTWAFCEKGFAEAIPTPKVWAVDSMPRQIIAGMSGGLLLKIAAFSIGWLTAEHQTDIAL